MTENEETERDIKRERREEKYESTKIGKQKQIEIWMLGPRMKTQLRETESKKKKFLLYFELKTHILTDAFP